MPSEKPTRILQSKTDLSLVEIEALDDAEAWGIIYALPPLSVATDDARRQVCFTGFGRSEKEALAALAEAAGLRVMVGVSKKLHWLVAGDKAGPKKLEKAVAQGIEVLDEAAFRTTIEKMQ